MQIKRALAYLLFVGTTTFLFGQGGDVYQKNGALQNNKESHVSFYGFDNFEPDVNKAALRSITKLALFKDAVFILDQQLHRMFVFDTKASFLYTIGRPGQGPGDLERPQDFSISDDGKIYFISPMAKQLDIFDTEGSFLERLKLSLPKELSYSTPSRILVGTDRRLFIAYNLSAHLIDEYGPTGAYGTTLLARKDPISVPGKNLGNCPQILFLNKNSRALLYFNTLTGIFTKLSPEGKQERAFGAFVNIHQQEMSKLRKDVEANAKNKESRLSVLSFKLWSNFCVDEHGDIFTLLLLKKKTESQKMFVFSSEGSLLYWTNIPILGIGELIRFIAFGISLYL